MSGYHRWMFPGTERYEIIRELGAGAFGAVYAARDRDLDRVVALKTMTSRSAGGLVAFKREFRRFSELRHPNVVRLYELEQHEESAFFTMEHVEGGRTWLEHVCPVESPKGVESDQLGATAKVEPGEVPQKLFHALAQLVAGLDAIHGIGFVHRDIKPANVLVHADATVKILDFGIAGAEESSDHTRTQGGFRGTPLYMAPEQSDKLPLSPMADWYAVGVMLFQALTGEAPFDGTVLQVLARKVVAQFNDIPDPPGEAGALLGIARGLMAPSPAGREAPLAELRRRLEPYAMTVEMRESGWPRGHATTTASSGGDGFGAGPSYAESRVRCVGREAELERIMTRHAETRDGRPRVTLLLAESGVGKSTLLREFARRARDGGAWVFAGRSGPKESISFKSLDPVVDALAEHLATLNEAQAATLLPRDVRVLADVFPALLRVAPIAALPSRRSGGSPQEQLAVAANALSELLGAMADQRPVALLFDDMQWGDGDSVAVFRALLGGARPPACHFVFAARSEELGRSEVLADLLRSLEPFDAERVELGGLSEESSLAIACERLGDEDPHVEALARASAENGFFLDLLLRAACDGELPAMDAVDLVELIATRLGAVGPAATDVLRSVALAGRAVTRRLVRRATRRSKAEVSEALEELVSRGLLRRVASEKSLFEPYHDRVLEAVQRGLDDGMSREIHVALAEAERGEAEVAGVEPDGEFVFTQLVAAGRLADALPFAVGAVLGARAANALHHAEALARDAVRCAEAAGTDARTHYARLAYIQSELLRYDDAIATLSAGEEVCDDPELMLRRRRGLLLVFSDRVSEGHEVLAPVFVQDGVKRPGSGLPLFIGIAWMLLVYLVGNRFVRLDARPSGSDARCAFYHYLSVAHIMSSNRLALWATAVAFRLTLARGRRDDHLFAKGASRATWLVFKGLHDLSRPPEFDAIETPSLRVFAEYNWMFQETMSGRGASMLVAMERYRALADRADPSHLHLDFSVTARPEAVVGEFRALVTHDGGRIRMAAATLPLLRKAHGSMIVGELLGGPAHRFPFERSSEGSFDGWLEMDYSARVAVYRGIAQELLRRWRTIHARLPRHARFFAGVVGAFLEVAAHRPGQPHPPTRAARRYARRLPGGWGLSVRVLLAGHAFIRDDREGARRILEELIPQLEAAEFHHYVAASRFHLARLVRESDPARAEALLHDVEPYFERERPVDRVRFCLAIVPGFRGLYPERADLDVPIEGPELLPWARNDERAG